MGYSPVSNNIKDYFSIEAIHQDFTNGSFSVYYYVIEDLDGTIRFTDGCSYLNCENTWENNYEEHCSKQIIEKYLKEYDINLSNGKNKEEKYPFEMYVLYDKEDYKKLFDNLVNCRIKICCDSYKEPYEKFSFKTYKM